MVGGAHCLACAGQSCLGEKLFSVMYELPQVTAILSCCFNSSGALVTAMVQGTEERSGL